MNYFSTLLELLVVHLERILHQLDAGNARRWDKQVGCIGKKNISDEQVNMVTTESCLPIDERLCGHP